MTSILTADELHALTGKKTRPAQIVRLKAKGIRYIDDPAAAKLTVLWVWVRQAGGERIEDVTPDRPDHSWMQQRAVNSRA